MNTIAAENEVVITRIFNAPRELVWKAWTEPKRFKKWWGPKIFTCPICQIDLRVGGKYFWAMEWPDGKKNYNTGEYLEVNPPESLSFTNLFSDENGDIVPASYYGLPGEFPETMITTVYFESEGNKTKMTLRHSGLPAGEMSEMTKQGWN